MRERVDDVHVQGLAERARLLRAVHDRDLLHRRGQRGHELLAHERAIQAHLHEAHLLALGVQIVHDLLDHVAERAHGHDHAVGVGRAVVVEQLVVRSQLGVHLVHVVLDHRGQRIVHAVARLAMLEEDVAVLMAAAHGRTLGVQGVVAELAHGLHVAHVGEVLVVPHGDLLHFVRGAEAVEEVDEGDAALDGGQVRHGGQVHDLLHVRLGEHGEARLAARHDVGVVAEDGQRLGGQRARAHVEHARQLLGGHLVHVGDHEEQALGGGVGGGQRACGQRAVHRARGAALGLHLAHLHRGAEDVLLPSGGPLVHQVGHRARRGDRINARHLGKRIGDVRGGVVAVHGFEFSRHIPLLRRGCSPDKGASGPRPSALAQLASPDRIHGIYDTSPKSRCGATNTMGGTPRSPPSVGGGRLARGGLGAVPHEPNGPASCLREQDRSSARPPCASLLARCP